MPQWTLWGRARPLSVTVVVAFTLNRRFAGRECVARWPFVIPLQDLIGFAAVKWHHMLHETDLPDSGPQHYLPRLQAPDTTLGSFVGSAENRPLPEMSARILSAGRQYVARRSRGIFSSLTTAEVGPLTAKGPGDIRCGGEGSCALKDPG